MEFLHYVWAFLLAIVLLVFVHEFGHFTAARLCGVKVLRFSLGFGPTLFSRRLGNDATEWAISAIPLGGYVKMLDENEEDVHPGEKHRAFNNQALYKRSIIVLAGPLANICLAIAIYWIVFMAGTMELVPVLGPVKENSPAAEAGFVEKERITEIDGKEMLSWTDVRWAVIDRGIDKAVVDVKTRSSSGSEQLHKLNLSSVVIDEKAPDVLAQIGLSPALIKLPAVIGTVAPNSPAEKAHLQPGDEILKVNEQSIDSFQSLAQTVAKYPRVAIRIELKRNAQVMDIEATPDAVDVAGVQQGRLGIAVKDNPELMAAAMTVVRYQPLDAFVHAIRQAWNTSVFQLKVFGKMLTGQVSVRNISGPVTIADYAGQTAKMGLEAYIKFLALISISLGVLNLMPIPVLDGGHLLYYALEKIRGKPLSTRAMELGQQMGLFLLLCLMGLAFFNDFARFNFKSLL